MDKRILVTYVKKVTKQDIAEAEKNREHIIDVLHNALNGKEKKSKRAISNYLLEEPK